jgi:[acyl-carrier-protein] S-malonyltransferase
MSKSIFVFPGQGSQSLGMGKDLFENSDIVRNVFQEVGNAVGYSIADIMFGTDESALLVTKNAQLAIMTMSVSIAMVVMEKTGKTIESLCSLVAGHSVGQYSALCVSGAISITDTARLLLARGSAMEESAKSTTGGMAAMIGGDEQSISNLVEAAKATGVIVVANYNSPDQVVVSGERVAVEKACELAQGFGIKRAIMLNVSGGFHSPLMSGAKGAMQKALDDVSFKKPAVPVIDNTTAQPEEDPAKIKQLLLDQLDGSVRWTQTMQVAQKMGTTKLFELGNGRVLTGLCKKTTPEIETLNLSNQESIDLALRSLV